MNGWCPKKIHLILSTFSKPLTSLIPFSPSAAIYQIIMLTGSDFATPGRVEGDNAAEPTPRVLIILAFVLDRLVARNDCLVNGVSQSQQLEELGCCSSSSRHLGNSFNAFHGVRAPTISILKYLERIYKYTNCSPSCLVVGFVYIDRLIHRHPDSLVISLNVHRLLVTSVMVASKMLDDVWESLYNSHLVNCSRVCLKWLFFSFFNGWQALQQRVLRASGRGEQSRAE